MVVLFPVEHDEIYRHIPSVLEAASIWSTCELAIEGLPKLPTVETQSCSGFPTSSYSSSYFTIILDQEINFTMPTVLHRVVRYFITRKTSPTRHAQRRLATHAVAKTMCSATILDYPFLVPLLMPTMER
jgi:hypothetical protein